MALASFTFTVFGRPRPKQRPRLGRRGRVFTPQATRDYERSWGFEAGLAMPPDWDMRCEYHVNMRLYFRKGATPDLDNCIKICDGLNGVAWDDDRQVVSISALKLTDERERAEVTVERLTEPKVKPVRKRAPKARPSVAASAALMAVFGMKRAKRAPTRRRKVK